MFCNLNGKQLLLIILAIIILIWFVTWLMNRNKSTATTQQQLANPQRGLARNNQQNTTAQQPINAILSDQANRDAPFILYYFFNPNCGACKKFEPVWQQIVAEFKGVPGIATRAVDITDMTKPENESLSFYYNITQTPTIILATPTKHVEYSGNRSSEDITNFILTNLTDYVQQMN